MMLLALLFACHPKQDDSVETQDLASLQPVVSKELQAIDSLLWQQPDSALALLLPWFDTVHTDETFDNHYAHLLLAELLYKNDYAQTNREELRQAVAFFDSLVRQTPPLKGGRGDSTHTPSPTDRLAFLSARAHYINGVGYYEQDSVVQACKEYLKALETMESHFEEKDMVGEKARFMALTHTHLTGLFSDQYLHEQAIYFGARALDYYRKYEATPWHVAWVLDEIGMQFEMMERFDSASYYYGEAVIAVDDTNTLMYRDIATGLARLSYKKDKESQKSMSQLRNLLLRSESEKEYLARCIAIGGNYYYEKQYDSASAYLNRIFRDSQSVEARKQAAEWLVEICKAQGREDEIIGYATFLVPFATQDENAGKMKSQLTTLCQEYEQEKQEALHRSKLKEALRNSGFIVLGIVTAFMVGFAIYVIISKRRIVAERKTHRMQQAALSGRLKRSNSALKKLKTAQEARVSENPRRPEVYGKYEDETICRHILTVCNDKHNSFKTTIPISAYADIALDDAQKAQLKQAATRHYGELFGKLKRQYPNLKEKDLFYCYLCLLGLDNIQIAVLLQRSISTIWEREKRLQKMFGSPSKISVFLHEYMITNI